MGGDKYRSPCVCLKSGQVARPAHGRPTLLSDVKSQAIIVVVDDAEENLRSELFNISTLLIYHFYRVAHKTIQGRKR